MVNRSTMGDLLSESELRRLLPDRIRSIRYGRGWTQHQLAAALDMHPVTVANWERGSCIPTREGQERIARLAGIPLIRLLGTGGEWKIPPRDGRGRRKSP
jgi:transcriptional regulator with XRE-family HTH domain